MTSPSLAQIKADLRRAAGKRRDAHAGDATAIPDRFLAAVSIPPDAAVSGYWPMRGELDPRPLMTALSARGHGLCLPVVVGKDRPLLFRAWRPGDTLVPGGFGTQVPDSGHEEIVPRLLLVPLLAFDRAGYRLGYGGGFYDRTLADLRAGAALRAAGPVIAAGLAFSVQEMASVPHDANDARLDWIVTETEAIKIETSAR
jgi:5-formyltetrahydrofolate cyclo-ligase